jgi:hypothetical protein
MVWFPRLERPYANGLIKTVECCSLGALGVKREKSKPAHDNGGRVAESWGAAVLRPYMSAVTAERRAGGILALPIAAGCW